MRTLISTIRTKARPVAATAVALGKQYWLPISVLTITGVFGMTEHALAITVDASNPLSQGMDTTRKSIVVPAVESIGSLAIAGGLGTMAFRPDKKEAVQFASGAAFCGAGAVGGGYIYDKTITPLNQAAGLMLPDAHAHAVAHVTSFVDVAVAHVHAVVAVAAHVAAFLPHF